MKGYARIYRRLWDDMRDRALPVEDQAVAVNLISHQSNRVGTYRLRVGIMAEQFDWSPSTCLEALVRVVDRMEWEWNSPNRVLRIPSWWRWNPPHSPTNLRGYLSDLKDVPDCELRARAMLCPDWFGAPYKVAWRETVGTLFHVRLGSDRVSDPEGRGLSPPTTKAQPHGATGSAEDVHAHVKPEPEPEPDPEPEPEGAARARGRAEAQHSAQRGGSAARGRILPATWREMREKHPGRDLEAIALKLLDRHGRKPYRDLDESFRSWCQIAEEKDLDALANPAASTENIDAMEARWRREGLL